MPLEVHADKSLVVRKMKIRPMHELCVLLRSESVDGFGRM